MTEYKTLPWARTFRELVDKHKWNESLIVQDFLIYCYAEEKRLNERWDNE